MRGWPLLFERLTNCYPLQIHLSVHQPTPAGSKYTVSYVCVDLKIEFMPLGIQCVIHYRTLLQPFEAHHNMVAIAIFGEQSVSLPSSFNAGIFLSVGRCTYCDVLHDSKYAQNTRNIELLALAHQTMRYIPLV